MEIGNITKLTIGAVIAIVVLTAFSAPLITSMAEISGDRTPVTLLNDTGDDEVYLRSGGATVLTYSSMGLEIDGTKVYDAFTTAKVVFLSDDCWISFGPVGSGMVQYAGKAASSIGTASGDTVTLTIDGATMTLTVDNVEKFTRTSTWSYHVSSKDTATHVLKQGDVPAYLNSPDQIVAAGLRANTYYYVKDGEVTATKTTVTDFRATAEAVDNIDDAAIYTYAVSINTTDFVPSNWIVPVSIAAHEGNDGPVPTMINLVLIILVIALVAGVAGYAIRSDL